MYETLVLFTSDGLERRQQAARARQVREARRANRGARSRFRLMDARASRRT